MIATPVDAACPAFVVADGGPRRLAANAPATGTVALAWLGQAGFLVRTADHTLLIDPYLSDFLATKYRGREFPHERLMPAPLDVADLERIDFVFCTHRHSDHMDPETLGRIAAKHPRCRFILPAADADHARGLGLPSERLMPIDAGGAIRPERGLDIVAIAAAHESIDRDDAGRFRFLGYVVHACGLTLYHSGDTVVYPDLPATLARMGIECAILPVNGRDEWRSRRGVPGNMSAAEAIALCRTVRMPLLVPCHFGLFAFNTASDGDLELLRGCHTPRTLVPDVDHHLVLTPRRTSPESES